MPFNIQPFNFEVKPTGFDLGKALQSGFKTYKEFHEAANTPRRLSEELLAQQLQNRMNKPKAEHAEEITNADLNHVLAQTQGLSDTHGLNGLNRQVLQQKINQGLYDQQLNDRINNGGNQHPAGGSGQSSEGGSTLSSNMTNGLNAPVTQASGNPSLYHIDQMIDNSPRDAAALKKRGFEKKVTPHYDPRTGVTSVITQYPSGKVTVSASGVKSQNGVSPLTNKTRSVLQAQKQAIPQLKKIIKQLKEAPSPFEPELPLGLGSLYYPGDRANHKSLVNLGKDIFIKAKGLNVTDKSLETGQHILDRGKNESDKAYHKRLDELDAKLDDEEKEVNQSLDSGISTNTRKEEPKKSDPLGIR